MIEIDIPHEAYERATKGVMAYDLIAHSDAYDVASDAIRAAAPLILAAELERMAKEIGRPASVPLRARAKELRGDLS